MLICQPLSNHQKDRLDNLEMLWVKDLDDLDKLLDKMESIDVVALDTEFIKRDSYFPRLALIQVNTGDAIYLLDAPKLELYDFWQVLADMPTIVLHACGEDLGLFYLLSELPALNNVFDTQIAISFLTGELTSGYQKALQNTLDIHIDKGESQSNWLQRPLTYEQELYASNDVRYLLALYEALCRQLSDKNLLDFAIQDSLYYAKSLYLDFIVPDNELYLDIADYRYSRQQLAILQALCEWREQLSRSINRPRNHTLNTQALQEITEKSPTTLKQLGYTCTKPQTIRLYGNEILNIIQNVKKTDESLYPPKFAMPYHNLSEDIQAQLQIVIDEYAQSMGLPQNVVIRKKWFSCLNTYITNNTTNLPLWLTGWRKEWVFGKLIPTLEQLLKEREALNNFNSSQDLTITS